MTHVTCRLTVKNRDQLRNPALGNRVRATFTFTYSLALVVLAAACPEGTYKNFTAPGDQSTCLECPDPHQTSPEGSATLDLCRCAPGYQLAALHCTGDPAPSPHSASSPLLAAITAGAASRHGRRKRSLRRRCNYQTRQR